MVMRIYQSRHDQKTAQIDVYAPGCSHERRKPVMPDMRKAPVSNLDGASHAGVRSDSAADSMK
jgi:hypothetical protein